MAMQTQKSNSLKKKLSTIILKIKNHPFVTAIGVVGAVAGSISAIPSAWEFMTNVFDVPSCIFYAEEYKYADGAFIHDGQLEINGEQFKRWIEKKNGSEKVFAEFIEMKRSKYGITIKNITERIKNDTVDEIENTTMLIKLPPCGGTIRWTWQNPQSWTDLYETRSP